MSNSGLKQKGALAKYLRASVGASLVLVAASQVRGEIQFNFDETLSGSQPFGPTPWLVATFSDVTPGTVELTLAVTGLTGDQPVNQWYFNLNSALNPGDLNFTEVASTGEFSTPTVSLGENQFKPNWDGKYDILVGFAGSGGASKEFTSGDSITYDITGIPGLTSEDFLALSTTAAGHSPLYSVATVNGDTVIADTPALPDSSSTSLLLGMGTAALFAAHRVQRKIFA
jgi:hypothetical protein